MKTKKTKTNDFSLAFFEDGKEIKSHPDEVHHEIVMFFGDAPVPVTICELPLSTQCDDMGPDGAGGSKVAASYHITPEAMIKTGRCMAASFELLAALEHAYAAIIHEHPDCADEDGLTTAIDDGPPDSTSRRPRHEILRLQCR